MLPLETPGAKVGILSEDSPETWAKAALTSSAMEAVKVERGGNKTRKDSAMRQAAETDGCYPSSVKNGSFQ